MGTMSSDGDESTDDYEDAQISPKIVKVGHLVFLLSIANHTSRDKKALSTRNLVCYRTSSIDAGFAKPPSIGRFHRNAALHAPTSSPSEDCLRTGMWSCSMAASERVLHRQVMAELKRRVSTQTV